MLCVSETRARTLQEVHELMKLTQDQVRVILSTIQAVVPPGYGYYFILCPVDLDKSKIAAIGNLNRDLVPELLRALAEGMEEDPPMKLHTS